MNLIVDASVAVKWFSEEPGSKRAESLLASDDNNLIAPDLILAEIGNALRKKAAKKLLTPRQALDAVRHAPKFFDRLFPLAEMATRATEIALDLRHPIYDCFYLALAEREQMELVTDDKKLIAVAKKARVKVRAL
jgi:predicted nucleic acid-binding protein